MKKQYRIASYLLGLLCLVACTNDKFEELEFKEENSSEYTVRKELSEVEVKRFPLDKRSSFWHYSMHVDDYETVKTFSFINSITNSVYVYDSHTTELLSAINLEVEGPNGVGNLYLASHLMLEDGSFYLFNISLGTLFKIRHDATVEKKYLIRNYKEESSMSNPEPSMAAPLSLIGGELYIMCSMDRYQANYKETYNMMVFNLETEEYRFIYEFPDSYNSGYWGDVFKYIPSFDYNENKNHIVLSYPVDPNIYVMALDGSMVSSHFESSSYITEMPPMREDINHGIKKDHGVKDPEQTEYSLSTSDFNKIMYDKYRDVYYRIAYLRPTVEQLRSGRRAPDFSISVLNSDFVKIGEKWFDGLKFRASMVLVGSQGLLVGRTDLYASNEDQLPMSLFSLKNK